MWVKKQQRPRHGATGWFKIGKGVPRGCILLPSLFHLSAEYIMWNAKLDESQVGIKTAERNSNNLRYADDITPMAEGEEKLKSLLMNVKEENEKAGFKPVNLKGNQPWIFIGRTDAEAPVLWLSDVKSWLIGKNPDSGKYWGWELNRVAEDETVR